MSKDYGKAFEQKFKEDFLKLPGSTLDRLYDVTMGYQTVSQVSDFIGYIYPNLYYIECKAYAGASFPLAKLTQYPKLIQKAGIEGVRAGVVLWLHEKDVVLYIPVKTIQQLRESGEKSVGLRHLNQSKYKTVVVPSIKRRVFLDSDYTILRALEEGD